jgi:2'-5' RNA ligase
MPRLFIALDVPAAVRESLVVLRDDDLDGARWTKPEQLHCTLRFLGDTPEEQVPEIEAALARIDAPPSLSLEISGLTAFPSRRRPRVLVARVTPTDELMDLQRQIEAAVQELGVEPENRPFRPHVTVARLKRADAAAVHDWLRTHIVEAAFEADAFHLYASVLKPSGAVHERLASFALRASR